MSTTRSALVVATDRYDDPKLARLQAPRRDAEALADVLSDPAIGGFEVEHALNCPEGEVRRRLSRFFADRRRDDLLLVHFSCHGLENDSGGLYFAAPDTEVAHLDVTAIPAELVDRLMTQSRSRRIVLLLDCARLLRRQEPVRALRGDHRRHGRVRAGRHARLRAGGRGARRLRARPARRARCPAAGCRGARRHDRRARLRRLAERPRGQGHANRPRARDRRGPGALGAGLWLLLGRTTEVAARVRRWDVIAAGAGAALGAQLVVQDPGDELVLGWLLLPVVAAAPVVALAPRPPRAWHSALVMSLGAAGASYVLVALAPYGIVDLIAIALAAVIAVYGVLSFRVRTR